MAEIVQRMSEMEGGQWGEGEQRGDSLQNTKHKYKNAKMQKNTKNTEIQIQNGGWSVGRKVQNIFITNNQTSIREGLKMAVFRILLTLRPFVGA